MIKRDNEKVKKGKDKVETLFVLKILLIHERITFSKWIIRNSIIFRDTLLSISSITYDNCTSKIKEYNELKQINRYVYLFFICVTYHIFLLYFYA